MLQSIGTIPILMYRRRKISRVMKTTLAFRIGTIFLVSVGLEGLTSGVWAFMGTLSFQWKSPSKRSVCSTCFERTALERRKAGLEMSYPSGLEVPTAEIMDVLFPRGGSNADTGALENDGVACYSQRLQAGREAQGFLTTDALAARSLVPLPELTYGEYDLDFFFSLVDECLSIRAGDKGGDRAALESVARYACVYFLMHDAFCIW